MVRGLLGEGWDDWCVDKKLKEIPVDVALNELESILRGSGLLK